MDRVCAADGRLDVLTLEERGDLIVLLEKWCEENEIEIFEKSTDEYGNITAVRYHPDDSGMYQGC